VSGWLEAAGVNVIIPVDQLLLVHVTVMACSCVTSSPADCDNSSSAKQFYFLVYFMPLVKIHHFMIASGSLNFC